MEPTMSDFVDLLEKMLEERAGEECSCCPCQVGFNKYDRMIEIFRKYVSWYDYDLHKRQLQIGCKFCWDFMEIDKFCPCSKSNYGPSAPAEAWKRIKKFREENK